MSENIPSDFMLNPKHLQNFIEAMDAQEARINTTLQQLDEQKKKLESDLNGTKEQREALRKYKEFLDLKGFGFIKQNADAWGKEVKKHQEEEAKKQSEMMSSGSICGKEFFSNLVVYTCYKTHGHADECGFVENTGGNFTFTTS